MISYKKVTFCDYADYEEGKSCNGGCYGFETEFSRNESGLYVVSYYTTSDLDYCTCCGSFIGCDDHSDCEYETATADEVQDSIDCFLRSHADDKENCYVVADGSVLENPYEIAPMVYDDDDDDIINPYLDEVC